MMEEVVVIVMDIIEDDDTAVGLKEIANGLLFGRVC